MTASPDAPKTSEGGGFIAGLAVYFQPRVLLVMVLGFSSGLPLLLSLSTLSYWLDREGVGIETIGLFAVLGTPYTLKFLWAPIIDRVPLPGLTRLLGRRRSWLLVTQALVIAAMLAIGFSAPSENIALTAVAAFALAFASASQDIVVDAYRIELLPESDLGAGAANYVYGYRIAMLGSGAGALYLFGAGVMFPWIYAVMAAGMTVGVLAALFGPRAGDDDTVLERVGAVAWIDRAVIRPFADFMTRGNWLAILLFIALYKFGDAILGPVIMPFYNQTGFTAEEIATVAKVFGFVATLVGIGLGGFLVKALGIYRSLWVAGILQLLSNLLFAWQAVVGADVGWLAVTISGENLAGGIGTTVFVAYLSVLTNKAFTATQFALLSSFAAVARTVLSASSGYIVAATDWFTFFIVSTAAAVPGLLLLWWLGAQGFKGDRHSHAS